MILFNRTTAKGDFAVSAVPPRYCMVGKLLTDIEESGGVNMRNTIHMVTDAKLYLIHYP